MANLSISSRFCGPPQSGNGGYTAGLLASHLRGQDDSEFSVKRSVEVCLRKPTPLDTKLSVIRTDDEVHLMDGEELLAEAKLVEDLQLDVPKPVTFSEAKSARHRFISKDDHLFSGCFVCGTSHPTGMRLHPGPVASETKPVVACDWVVGDALAKRAIQANTAQVWAALDCPGYFGAFIPKSFTNCSAGSAGLYNVESLKPVCALLGKISAQVFRLPNPGERCIVMGWPIDWVRRKISVGSAVFSEAGEVIAKASAVWIQVDSSRFLAGAN